ncbi:FkbM family methyltransferase [uncultured Cohaesibacter sp.]|uniref:FkbM family methyltransferase n=1 Tax=uncultured Cohaesibacter sp. TaxID=1002546 RepID=UPI0029C7BB2B|nr:FkbM family methyltransferase [uncultured Cohaesibacter sp.]
MADNVCDTLYGPLHIADWPDDLLIRSLKQLGEWSAAETIIAATIVEDDQPLWDCGAFLGTFSLGIAHQNRRPSKVIAVEANPALAPLLEKNLSLLPCPHHLVSSGLGNQSGWIVPKEEDSANHGATAYQFQKECSDPARAIACASLEDLRKEHGDYQFIKVDLEGMELETLLGDRTYLKQCHPVIWAECNEDKASLDLLKGLRALGYNTRYVAFPAFRKNNFNQSTDLIYPMAYEAALVAAHPAKLETLDQAIETLLPEEDIIYRKVETGNELALAMFDTPRWSSAAWATMNRAELIARLGRLQRKLTIHDFLDPKPTDSN